MTTIKHPFRLSLMTASLGLAVLALSNPARAADLSGSATATSDYVFRGVSQTQEDPALQLGAKLAFDNGLYVGGWTSNVDYGDAVGSNAEIDGTVGWSGELAKDWALDANLTRYTYPGTNDGFDLDYNELVGTLTWKNRWFGTLGYSNDVFASGEPGTYVQVGGKFPINDQWRIEAAVGHYDLQDALGDSYQHATVSAIYAYKKAEFRVTGHATSGSTKDLFGDVGASRVEFAAAINF